MRAASRRSGPTSRATDFRAATERWGHVPAHLPSEHSLQEHVGVRPD